MSAATTHHRFIPESPRWLLAVGRKEEAHAILEAAAKANGRDAAETKTALLHHHSVRSSSCHGAAQPRAGLGGLMRTPRLRRMSLCLFFTWFVVGLGFFGFSQFQGQIGGDIFVNVALSGKRAVSQTRLGPSTWNTGGKPKHAARRGHHDMAVRRPAVYNALEGVIIPVDPTAV